MGPLGRRAARLQGCEAARLQDCKAEAEAEAETKVERTCGFLDMRLRGNETVELREQG